MNLDEIQAAIGGPNGPIAQPDGGDVVPLNTGGLDKTIPEPFPANVNAQQGAGSTSGGLTPGASGVASDGTVEPGNDDHYSSQGGPVILPAVKGLAALTPDPSGARPEGGAAIPGEQPGAAKDPRLGGDQTGQPLNPALKKALSPRQGPFGPPSFK